MCLGGVRAGPAACQAVFCTAALFSPSTGIVDSHAFMLGLQGDLEDSDGFISVQSPVVGGEPSQRFSSPSPEARMRHATCRRPYLATNVQYSSSALPFSCRNGVEWNIV